MKKSEYETETDDDAGPVLEDRLDAHDQHEGDVALRGRHHRPQLGVGSEYGRPARFDLQFDLFNCLLK